MIYFDTSALMKLLRRETESRELISWLEGRPARWMTSQITEVELPMAISRYGLSPQAPTSLLDRLTIIDLTSQIAQRAATFAPLRSLDAIHVATAEFLAEELGTTVPVLTYDARMLSVCEARGIPAHAPGTQAV